MITADDYEKIVKNTEFAKIEDAKRSHSPSNSGHKYLSDTCTTTRHVSQRLIHGTIYHAFQGWVHAPWEGRIAWDCWIMEAPGELVHFTVTVQEDLMNHSMQYVVPIFLQSSTAVLL